MDDDLMDDDLKRDMLTSEQINDAFEEIMRVVEDMPLIEAVGLLESIKHILMAVRDPRLEHLNR